MPYLLADSFGGLGQQALAADQNRRLSLASAVSSAMQGQQFALRNAQADRALDLQEAEGEFEYGPEGHPEEGFKSKDLALRTAIAQQNANEAAARQATADQWVKIGQQQVDNQKLINPTMANQNQRDYMNALGNAQQFGAWDNEDEIGAAFPNLTPGQRTAIAMVSRNVRAQKDQEYNLGQNAAGALNQRDALKQRFAEWGIANPSQATAPTSGWFTGDAAKQRNQEIAKALTQWKTISPKASRVEADKRLSSLVTYDPTSDSWQPAMPMPPWQQQPTTSSGATPQAPTGNAGTSTGTGAAPAPAPLSMAIPRRQPTAADINAVAGPVTTRGTVNTGQRYDPWVYQRVNDLISAGANPFEAKKQAVSEWTQAQGAGNLP